MGQIYSFIINTHKYDNMHRNEIIYVLICINNHVLSCLISMLSVILCWASLPTHEKPPQSTLLWSQLPLAVPSLHASPNRVVALEEWTDRQANSQIMGQVTRRNREVVDFTRYSVKNYSKLTNFKTFTRIEGYNGKYGSNPQGIKQFLDVIFKFDQVGREIDDKNWGKWYF